MKFESRAGAGPNMMPGAGRGCETPGPNVMPGDGRGRVSAFGGEGRVPDGAYRASWLGREATAPGGGAYRAACMLYDSKERPDSGPLQEPKVLGDNPDTDCCSLAVSYDCAEDIVPNDAADVGCGATEAGRNVGGEEDRGWILLVVSMRNSDVLFEGEEETHCWSSLALRLGRYWHRWLRMLRW